MPAEILMHRFLLTFCYHSPSIPFGRTFFSAMEVDDKGLFRLDKPKGH